MTAFSHAHLLPAPRAVSACGWAAGTPGGIDPRNRRPYLPAGDINPVIQLDRFY